MSNISIYKPYEDWKSFEIIKKDRKKFLKMYEYILEIDEDNYMPKAGLLFEEILKGKCNNKRVLDLGCGQLGILGIIALHYGAKELVAMDVDERCVNWLKKIVSDNNIKNMLVLESDLFSKIEDNQKFDLILSNPPHMPMKEGRLCDSGGSDGKYYIKEIIRNAIKYLNDGGELNLMMFDFLGIDTSYNNDESIFEFAKRNGYKDMQVIYRFEKNITDGSVTYSCLEYIKEIYPNYNFDETNPKCNLIICKLKK